MPCPVSGLSIPSTHPIVQCLTCVGRLLAGPEAYYITLEVPTGTTRQQVEDGLKAAWAALELTTDGCYRTSFCVAVNRQYRRCDRALLNTSALVFVESRCALSPSQALAWVQGAVPSSKLAWRRHLHAITDAEEADCFRRQKEGQQGLVYLPWQVRVAGA
jgi:hypothetical protein